jgi:hypothetical protein
MQSLAQSRLRERLVARNFWSTGRTGHAGDFATLMILWVPPVAIMGGAAAAVLFGVVAVIVSFNPGRIEASDAGSCAVSGQESIFLKTLGKSIQFGLIVGSAA